MELPMQIDPYLFEKQLSAFEYFVQEQAGVPFISFASNPYMQEQEGYKYQIYQIARQALAYENWKESDIGTGKIAEATISAIEIKKNSLHEKNNLLPWEGKYGPESRPHHVIHDALEKRNHDLEKIESMIFSLYRTQTDSNSFQNLVSFFGKRYPLIAYLFFLKDRSRFLPIAPQTFDQALSYLGSNFKTSHQCSWENYSDFINLVSEIRQYLSEEIDVETTLLDAHSFAYMLAKQMKKAGKLADVKKYLALPQTERKAIINARIGQGRFRDSLIDYWSFCAVTGCTHLGLLIASHIKPWSESNDEERLSLFNGILLSPSLDACFDSGLISFDDEGKILISTEISSKDAAALGLSNDMRLCRIEPEHRRYLAYHRKLHEPRLFRPHSTQKSA